MNESEAHEAALRAYYLAREFCGIAQDRGLSPQEIAAATSVLVAGSSVRLGHDIDRFLANMRRAFLDAQRHAAKARHEAGCGAAALN